MVFYLSTGTQKPYNPRLCAVSIFILFDTSLAPTFTALSPLSRTKADLDSCTTPQGSNLARSSRPKADHGQVRIRLSRSGYYGAAGAESTTTSSLLNPRLSFHCSRHSRSTLRTNRSHHHNPVTCAVLSRTRGGSVSNPLSRQAPLSRSPASVYQKAFPDPDVRGGGGDSDERRGREEASESHVRQHRQTGGK